MIIPPLVDTQGTVFPTPDNLNAMIEQTLSVIHQLTDISTDLFSASSDPDESLKLLRNQVYDMISNARRILNHLRELQRARDEDLIV